MTRQEAEQALVHIGETAEEGFDLLEAAIACALHEAPGRDPVPVRRLADEAADRVAERLMRESPEDVLSDVLAGEMRLAGDLAHYERPENADIICVAERRRGLPVALGVFYIAVARRCGITATGVDFPGHFLLQIETPNGQSLIDPFSHGRVILQAELIARAAQTGAGSGGEDQLGLLTQSMSDHAVMLRLENNIHARAAGIGDHARAERSALRRVLLNPGDHRYWVDIAIAREGQGALTGALEALARAQRLDMATTHTARVARDRVKMKLN